MARRWRRLFGSITVLTALAMLASCTGPTAAPPDAAPASDPAATIAQFAADWQAGRTQDASAWTTDPSAAAQLMSTVMGDLKATNLKISTGRVDRTSPSAATVTATMTWTLPVAGAWTYAVPWHWSLADPGSGSGSASGGRWLLDYSPQIIHPDLGPGQTLSVRVEPASDGPLVDRNDAQLIAPVRVYSVVLLITKVADLAATAKSLTAILGKLDPTVTEKSITAGVKAAKAAGQASYTVTNLRENDFTPVEAKLSAIDGVSLPSTMRDLPPTAGFAQAVLGTAVPVARKLAAGKPGWRVITVDMAGDELQTIAQQQAVPGPKVVFTLDPAVQEAAQAALDPITEPAVLVAIQPSTGGILAVAQNAAANADGPIALTGRYPPGSTFKIVTATAAIDAGLITPTTMVSCPGEWTTNNRTIHNEGFSLGTVTATTAFSHSCNTTFAMLAARMADDALPTAARQYGIGLDFDIAGITTLTGAIQPGDSTLARAENGFGQGTDLLTPFSAALMAATAAAGNMPMPVLIRGTTTTVDHPAPPRSPAAQAALKTMMRAVVTDGTAKGLKGDGEVYAKTGTAEYVDASGQIQAHAWTVGFRGDVAFSVLIVGGNSSKRSNDIVHAFLGALPKS